MFTKLSGELQGAVDEDGTKVKNTNRSTEKTASGHVSKYGDEIIMESNDETHMSMVFFKVLQEHEMKENEKYTQDGEYR